MAYFCASSCYARSAGSILFTRVRGKFCELRRDGVLRSSITLRASLLGYDNPVRCPKRKGAPRSGQQEDLHRPGRRRPPPRLGHNPQGDGTELRRRLHDHRGGPPSGRDDPSAHPRPRGRVRLRIGGEVDLRCRRGDRARPGRLVRRQAEGDLHAFCNTGTGPNRHLEIHAPGEFEDYYDEYERIVESEMDEEERTKARAELGERYGVTWHEELIPEVRARFGLEP